MRNDSFGSFAGLLGDDARLCGGFAAHGLIVDCLAGGGALAAGEGQGAEGEEKF